MTRSVDSDVRLAARTSANTSPDSRCHGNVTIDRESLMHLRDQLPGLTWDLADENTGKCELWAWRVEDRDELTGGGVYLIETESPKHLVAWEVIPDGVYQDDPS